MAHLTGIVLAAGASTRMGEENKLLLPFQDKTVLGSVVEAICASPVDDVIVVTGHQDRQIRDILAHQRVRIAYNPEFAEGIATSIRRGILAGTQDTDGFVLCLGDMPFITDLTIRRLCEVFIHEQQPSIVVATFRGRRSHPVVFHREFRTTLMQMHGDGGVQPILEEKANAVVEVEVRDERVLADIDTWDTYDSMGS